MSTNHTANYDLCQWEATDQVLHTDFNEDNAKLEAALAGKLGVAELIGEVTLNKTDFDVELDLSDVNWNQWSLVVLFTIPNGGSNVQNYSFFLQGITTSSLSMLSADITPLVGPQVIVMFPLRDAQREVRYLTFPGGQVTVSKDNYNKIQKVYASTNTSSGMLVGSYIQAIGIR